MVKRKYGYKKTEVSGTKFTIKERFEGSEESSVGRRLATRDDIKSVHIEHDGVITIHVTSDERYVASDYIPDDYCLVDAMIHSGNSTNSHIDFTRVE